MKYRHYSIIWFLAGVYLIYKAITLSSFLEEKFAIGFSWSESRTHEAIISTFQDVSDSGEIHILFPIPEFMVMYPRTMKIDETKKITLLHNFPRQSSGNRPLPDIECIVHSPSLSVTPENSIRRPSDVNSTSKFEWLVTPIKTGTHKFILETSYLEPQNITYDLLAKHELENMVYAGNHEYDVSVLTIYNVDRVYFEIFRTVMIIIGAFLGSHYTGIIIKWIKSKITSK